MVFLEIATVTSVLAPAITGVYARYKYKQLLKNTVPVAVETQAAIREEEGLNPDSWVALPEHYSPSFELLSKACKPELRVNTTSLPKDGSETETLPAQGILLTDRQIQDIGSGSLEVRQRAAAYIGRKLEYSLADAMNISRVDRKTNDGIEALYYETPMDGETTVKIENVKDAKTGKVAQKHHRRVYARQIKHQSGDGVRYRSAERVAALVREKMGPVPERNVANKSIAWRHAVGVCNDLKITREVDRQMIIPLAVSYVFKPTKYDIMARQLEATEVFEESRELHEREWQSASRQGWLRWLLFKTFEQKPKQTQ